MHNIPRRRALQWLGSGALAATSLAAAQAQSSKTLRLLVGFPPGGGTDAIARLLADKLKDELGQPVIVENKAGAGGQLAAQALKAAAPDGSTMFLTHDHTVSILPLVVKNPGFDTAQDFVPVAGFATSRTRSRSRAARRRSRWRSTWPGSRARAAARAPSASRRRPRCRSSWSRCWRRSSSST